MTQQLNLEDLGSDLPVGETTMVEPLMRGRKSSGRHGTSPKSRRHSKPQPKRSHERRSLGSLAVTQGNPLALSRQEMGILTKRLLVLALSDITKEDLTLEPIRITAWEYAQLFNISGKSIYSRIEESARELLEQTIQIKEPNGDWVMFQWVSEARYDNGREGGQMAAIEIKIHDRLKPYLLQLRRDFSIIPTEQLLSFESFNSMRLFEVLYTASYAGERTELIFDVDDLKLRLGLDGKYERFKDFRYVLDKAQEEFLAYTCLAYRYEPLKVGRKLQRVRFTISRNDVFKPRVRLPASLASRVARAADKEQLLKELQAVDALRDVGWAQDAERTVTRYGPQRVLDTVAYARVLQTRAEQSGRPIFNLAGFVNSLLQQGVEPPSSHVTETGEREGPLSREEARAVAAAIADALHQERLRRAEAAWQQLTTEQRDLIHTLMQATLRRFSLERIEAANWTGPLYESSRMDVMAAHNFMSFPPNLQDLDSFVETYDRLDEYDDEDTERILAELKELG